VDVRGTPRVAVLRLIDCWDFWGLWRGYPEVKKLVFGELPLPSCMYALTVKSTPRLGVEGYVRHEQACRE
jgi:hypothetical protein